MHTRLSSTACHITTWLLTMGVLASCSKGFLTTPPDSDLQVPKTLTDVRKILDQEILFSQTPANGTLSADEFYFTTVYQQQSLLPLSYRLYTWASTVFTAEAPFNDWDIPYQQVYYCNQVLAKLQQFQIPPDSIALHHALEGTALFCRAYAFYGLAQQFTPVFDSATRTKLLGIPLPVSEEVAAHATRSTIEQTYNQVISDLRKATTLLPDTISKQYPNHPSKAAAWAMLARVYLSMRCYPQALEAASHSLQRYSILLDYNEIKFAKPSAFAANNAEVLYQSKLEPGNDMVTAFSTMGCLVDTGLCKLYAAGDLRPGLFFITKPVGSILAGTYYGDRNFFSGLATDEVWLIRAEGNVRMGNTTAALSDLNTLLRNRYKKELFVPLQSTDAQQVLRWILEERRKELILRGLRWSDLRRLNEEKDNAISISRKSGEETITLSPGAAAYTLPIPLIVIRLNNMSQNPR